MQSVLPSMFTQWNVKILVFASKVMISSVLDINKALLGLLTKFTVPSLKLLQECTDFTLFMQIIQYVFGAGGFS